jgi:hypothetical protein
VRYFAKRPLGVVFSASSQASITVPVPIDAGEKDSFLVSCPTENRRRQFSCQISLQPSWNMRKQLSK